MRTRSSRFFVILLHLVGVCHHHRGLRWFLFFAKQQQDSSSSLSSSGIVAVHPWPVQLEALSLNSYAASSSRSSEGRKRHHHSTAKRRRRRRNSKADQHEENDDELVEQEEAQHHYDMDNTAEPIWLQDQDDLLCLGPTGTFTECGDATLWFVQREPLPPAPKKSGPEKRRLLLSGLFGLLVRQEPAQQQKAEGVGESPLAVAGWTFQVVDMDIEDLGSDIDDSTANIRQQQQTRQPGTECLDVSEKNDAVEVLSCRRRRRNRVPVSGVWLIDAQGALQLYDANKKKKVLPPWRRRKVVSDDDTTKEKKLCMYRGADKEAVVSSCYNNDDDGSNNQTAPVRFSFVRYRAVTVPVSPTTTANAPSHSDSSDDYDSNHRGESATTMPSSSPTLDTTTTHHLPSNGGGKAHYQALSSSSSSPHHHTTAQSELQKLQSHQLHLTQSRVVKQSIPYSVLKDTNPILLAGDQQQQRQHWPKQKATTTNTLHHKKPDHKTITPLSPTTSRRRIIHVHPYIEKAVNEVWTDPQTGLDYYTDLCRYLGDERQQHGRHTLMGVGQFRKGYVIKVYGIAYYVSKRDVLANPTFEQYASLSAEELRAREDFYRNLRGPDLGVKRTILLKTNMQLSADTMRSSLQSEWELLTEEAKTTLVGSSLAAREADAEMLKIIQNTAENPSRCSCAQSAPPELSANPECCARGTELAFTWLKNGDLEVRGCCFSLRLLADSCTWLTVNYKHTHNLTLLLVEGSFESTSNGSL